VNTAFGGLTINLYFYCIRLFHFSFLYLVVSCDCIILSDIRLKKLIRSNQICAAPSDIKYVVFRNKTFKYKNVYPIHNAQEQEHGGRILDEHLKVTGLDPTAATVREKMATKTFSLKSN
jgi:hypothetical protein